MQVEGLAVTDGISFGRVDNTDDAGNVLGSSELLHVLDRFQVPVLLRFTPPLALPLRPFVFAGPYASARLREYDRSTGSLEFTRTNQLLRSHDFGVTAGGGLQARLGPGQLEVQARYDQGLTDLGDFLGVGSPRTGAFRVLAGYSL